MMALALLSVLIWEDARANRLERYKELLIDEFDQLESEP